MLSAILRVFFGIAFVFGIMPLVVIVGFIFFTGSSKCGDGVTVVTKSPTGIWQVQGVFSHCEYPHNLGINTAPGELIFQIARPGDKLDKENILIEASEYRNDWHQHSLTKDWKQIFFIWEDDQNLLVAAPDDMPLKPLPLEFEGIKIRSIPYPNNADKARDEKTRAIFRKNLTFSYSFKDNYNPSGLSCSLEMTANDGSYIDKINLSLGAGKHYALKAWKYTKEHGYKLTPIPEGIDNGFQFHAYKNENEKLSAMTSIEMEGFSSAEGMSSLWARDKLQVVPPPPPPVPLYNGWIYAYTLNDQKDLRLLVDKLLEGSAKIKIGFWIDNAEVIYSISKPKNPKEVELFKKCLDKNGLF